MKFALVEGQRREAEPGLPGVCQGCGSAMVAKCGERRVWHWAHKGKRVCDRWWEPETEWHRAWKDEFPVEWQEFRHQAEDGEWHIADVRTEHGQVIEFQHSHLPPDERRAREAFYRRMVWVVNGLRRKRDRSSFDKARELARVVSPIPLALAVSADEGALLRDWADSRVEVYFDFGDSVLWCLLPIRQDGKVLLHPVTRTDFVNAFRTGVDTEGIDFTKKIGDAAFVGNRLRFGLPRDEDVTVAVRAQRWICQSCRREVQLVTGIDVMIGPNEFQFLIPTIRTKYPDLFEIVRSNFPKDRRFEAIEPRYRASQKHYVSNRCPHCDAAIGDCDDNFFDFDGRTDEERVCSFQSRFSEGWHEAVLTDGRYRGGWGVN